MNARLITLLVFALFVPPALYLAFTWSRYSIAKTANAT